MLASTVIFKFGVFKENFAETLLNHRPCIGQCRCHAVWLGRTTNSNPPVHISQHRRKAPLLHHHLLVDNIFSQGQSLETNGDCLARKMISLSSALMGL